MGSDQISSPGAKLVIAWGGVGISWTMDWPQIAGMLASLYTLLLIGEWVWKRGGRYIYEKYIKPLFSRKGR